MVPNEGRIKECGCPGKNFEIKTTQSAFPCELKVVSKKFNSMFKTLEIEFDHEISTLKSEKFTS
jgi:hypothetical protein